MYISSQVDESKASIRDVMNGFGISHPECTRQTCRSDTSEGLSKLEVNFDPALVVVLCEVRYFLGMRNPSIEVPAVGLKVQSPDIA